MIALISTIFVASLLGSPHCAGMCGGIVALCAGIDQSNRQRFWIVPAMYNLGRLATYCMLGAIAGAVGSAIDFGGAAAGLQHTALVLAGAGMIAIGVISLLRANGVRIGCAKQPLWMQQITSKAFRAAYARPPIVRAAIIGLLTGLLPCGWLYAFVIVSAGTGNAAMGALTMAVFWAGTLPIMLTLGLGLRVLAGPLRQHVPTITGVVLVFIGFATVLGRFTVPSLAESTSLRTSASALNLDEQVKQLSSTNLPCCHDHAESEK